VNRRAQAIVLLLVGGAVLRTSLSDLYLRYVKQGLRPFLIAAGILLVVTAVTTLWYELRRPDEAEHEGHGVEGPGLGGYEQQDFDGGHGHSHQPRVAWMLLLPVLALLLIAPPALGSYAANQSGTALGEPTSDFAALPAGDPVQISLLDYASRAVFDDGRTLAERRIQLSGFVTAGENGELYLARMILSCCAADARPIKVGLTGDVPAGLMPDTWLRVVGTYTPQRTKDAINGETIPYVAVSKAELIKAPPEQYES
jgi:uncharacterized repeat protein (TIGR03943 family)